MGRMGQMILYSLMFFLGQAFPSVCNRNPFSPFCFEHGRPPVPLGKHTDHRRSVNLSDYPVLRHPGQHTDTPRDDYKPVAT